MYFRVQFIDGSVKYIKANSLEQLENYHEQNEVEGVDFISRLNVEDWPYNDCDFVDYDISSKKIGRYYV